MSYYGNQEHSNGPSGSANRVTGNSAPSQAGPPRLSFDRKGYLGGVELAGLGSRIASGLIDWLPALLVAAMFASIGTGLKTQQTCNQFVGCFDQTVESHDLAGVGWFFAIAWVIANQVVLQSRTGQSLGKRIMKTHLAWPVTEPGRKGMVIALPGPEKCALRAIIGSMIAGLGFLPDLAAVFLTGRLQSLGDKAAGTVVLAPGHGLVYLDVDRETAKTAL